MNYFYLSLSIQSSVLQTLLQVYFCDLELQEMKIWVMIIQYYYLLIILISIRNN